MSDQRNYRRCKDAERSEYCASVHNLRLVQWQLLHNWATNRGVWLWLCGFGQGGDSSLRHPLRTAGLLRWGGMKLFWIGYPPFPLCFLIFVCPRMENAVLQTTFVIAVLLSVTCLIFRRREIIGKKYQLLLGLLAGVASVAVGFIIIMAIILIGSAIPHRVSSMTLTNPHMI
jgi:hypothetical protein